MFSTFCLISMTSSILTCDGWESRCADLLHRPLVRQQVPPGTTYLPTTPSHKGAGDSPAERFGSYCHCFSYVRFLSLGVIQEEVVPWGLGSRDFQEKVLLLLVVGLGNMWLWELFCLVGLVWFLRGTLPFLWLGLTPLFSYSTSLSRGSTSPLLPLLSCPSLGFCLL